MHDLARRLGFGVVIASFAAGLTACSSGPEREGPDRREAGLYIQGLGGGQIIRPGPSANEAYSVGMDLKAKGDCKGAVDKLTPVANLGPGYENAQAAVGECLLIQNSASDSGRLFEAMMWLTRAADGGWTEAQGKLAEVYALGPAGQRNLDEAAYWFVLYRMNASMKRIGFTPMDPDVAAKIAAVVGPERIKAAEPRAAAWQMKPWVPPRATPDQPGPERRGMRGGRRDRMSGDGQGSM